MNWAWIIGLGWLAIASAVALLIARMVRAADDRERPEDDFPVPNRVLDDEYLRRLHPERAPLGDDAPTGIIAEAPPERPAVAPVPPAAPVPAPRPAVRPAQKRGIARPSARHQPPWTHDISSGPQSGAA